MIYDIHGGLKRTETLYISIITVHRVDLILLSYVSIGFLHHSLCNHSVGVFHKKELWKNYVTIQREMKKGLYWGEITL